MIELLDKEIKGMSSNSREQIYDYIISSEAVRKSPPDESPPHFPFLILMISIVFWSSMLLVLSLLFAY